MFTSMVQLLDIKTTAVNSRISVKGRVPHHDSYLSIIPLPCPISLIDLILSMPDVYASSNLTLTKTFFEVLVILERSNSIIIDCRHHLKIFLQKVEKRQYLTI